jgi:hypothetical protein
MGPVGGVRVPGKWPAITSTALIRARTVAPATIPANVAQRTGMMRTSNADSPMIWTPPNRPEPGRRTALDLRTDEPSGPTLILKAEAIPKHKNSTIYGHFGHSPPSGWSAGRNPPVRIGVIMPRSRISRACGVSRRMTCSWLHSLIDRHQEYCSRMLHVFRMNRTTARPGLRPCRPPISGRPTSRASRKKASGRRSDLGPHIVEGPGLIATSAMGSMPSPRPGTWRSPRPRPGGCRRTSVASPAWRAG